MHTPLRFRIAAASYLVSLVVHIVGRGSVFEFQMAIIWSLWGMMAGRFHRVESRRIVALWSAAGTWLATALHYRGQLDVTPSLVSVLLGYLLVHCYDKAVNASADVERRLRL